ncbi:hypothetical protein GKE82_13505 [Conexibacter sp. W3-3-2]|uniref:hypothetical protein n=1 Tax=Conexibacter sp. W3-3-2 TaxID=2675227 RepID=UPI0012B92ADE|nr:hypothetical protein [Conexibacter sp. W3-3-2]MTD45275.1 hypothetical protein [Conexibacter sp. W3-3-2]
MVDAGALLVALATGAGVVAATPLGDVRWSVVLVLVATGLLAGAGLASGQDATATMVLVPAAVAFACAGMLFARVFHEPAFVLAIPLLVAALELVGGDVRTDATDTVDRVLASSVFFLAVFATWARRDGRLRRGPTLVALALAPALAGLVGDLVDGFGTAPIAFVAAALLVPNADRLVREPAGA